MQTFDSIAALCRAASVPAAQAAREAAHRRWASLAHPLGSLGLLETMLEDAAALTGSAELDFSRRAVLVLCADNGVVAQGVTQTGPEATAAVARGLAAGRSPVCRMARAARCRVVPVDMGILDFAPTEGVLSCRVGNGTGDITAGPAMSRAQAEQAVLTGAALAARQAGAGTTLLATGEMGIGNTTTTAAVAAALLRTGIDYQTVNKVFFRTKSRKRMQLEAAILNDCEFYDRDRVAVVLCHDGGEVTEKLTLWFFDEVPGEAAPASWLAGELGIDTNTPLTAEELTALEDHFNDREYNGLLRFPYDDASQAADYLSALFYDLGEDESTLTEEEKAALEKKAEESKPVLDFLKETLGDQIKEARVSRILRSGAVCLTADGPITLEMEKYFQRVDPENARNMKAQRVLELNPDSPAFAALQQAVETDRDKAAKYAQLLYAQAQLIAGIPLEDPAGYTELVCSLMV